MSLQTCQRAHTMKIFFLLGSTLFAPDGHSNTHLKSERKGGAINGILHSGPLSKCDLKPIYAIQGNKKTELKNN